MTSSAAMRTIDDTHGAVRAEDVYDTDIDDLWEACTAPDRLARWIAVVSGEPRVGATVHATYVSTWSGPIRIDACEAPRHLLLTNDPGTDDETQLELWLSDEGTQTRLVIEERGLPAGTLHYFGAGWQVHLEDLGRSLDTDEPVHASGWSAEAPAPGWRERWAALTPDYERMTVD